MAAVLTPRTDLAPWNESPSHRPRPELRLIGGGADGTAGDTRPVHPDVAQRSPGVVVAGVVLAVVLMLGVVGAVRLLGADAAAPGPASTATSPRPVGVDASVASVPSVVVVQPGDTLWGIARRLQPSGDVRPLVDRLAERAGGAGVQAGQRIDIGGLAG